MMDVRIRNLDVDRGGTPILRRVSVTATSGTCLGIVGESGSGKSTLLQAVSGLLPLSGGSVEMVSDEGKVLVSRRPGEHKDIIQMVFQDPTASLDPRWPSWRIVTECLPEMSSKQAKRAACEVFETVELDPSLMDRLPFELSGGQKQRLGIGRALANKPSILLLDEPVSALDVSVQAGILNLLKQLQRDRGLTYLFVSHDLAVVSYMAQHIAVLKRGQVVEDGEASQILKAPRHPYTKSLIQAAAILE